MELRNRLQNDMKAALKAGDKPALGCIRMLQSKILEKEIELRASRGREYHLTDDEIVDVIASYAKQRRQSIESYQAAGRQDLVEKEQQELNLVESYLPQQLSDAALIELVDRTIQEAGAASLKDLGRVMKAVMASARGAADGKRVNQTVRERIIRLQGGE